MVMSRTCQSRQKAICWTAKLYSVKSGETVPERASHWHGRTSYLDSPGKWNLLESYCIVLELLNPPCNITFYTAPHLFFKWGLLEIYLPSIFLRITLEPWSKQRPDNTPRDNQTSFWNKGTTLGTDSQIYLWKFPGWGQSLLSWHSNREELKHHSYLPPSPPPPCRLPECQALL